MASSRETQELPRASHARTYGRRPGRGARALVALAAIVTLGACGGAQSVVRTSTAPNLPAGTLYFATSSVGAPPVTTTLHALKAGDGKPRWQTQVVGTSTPLVYNGATLFLGTVQVNTDSPPSGGTLTAVSAATGAKAWQHDFPGQAPLPIAASADSVFVSLVPTTAPQGGPPAASIAALHASDGSVAWTSDPTGLLAGRAVLSDTALYAITYTGATATATTPPTFSLVALGISDGKPLWHQTVAGPPVGELGPMLSGGALYLVEEPTTPPGAGVVPSSIIEAVKASDGTRLWHTTSLAGTAAMSLLANAEGIFYTYSSVATPGGGLVALHASDGSVAWQATVSNAAPTLLAADGGVVYTKEVSGKSAAGPSLSLRAFDAQNGTARFERPFPTLPLQLLPKGSGPGTIGGGALYLIAVAVHAGTPAVAYEQLQSFVLALRASDGKALWNRALDGNPTSQVFYAAP
jgi:outer membrane protein assembly factor BamB